MRGLGLFFGNTKRNDPIRMHDPRPLPVHDDATHTGDAGKDGYTVLSRASPDAQGAPPPVSGVAGPTYRGPDQSFEQ
jgi:hypothetical protein